MAGEFAAAVYSLNKGEKPSAKGTPHRAVNLFAVMVFAVIHLHDMVVEKTKPVKRNIAPEIARPSHAFLNIINANNL